MNHIYKQKYKLYKQKYIIAKIKNTVILTPDSIAIVDYLNKLNYKVSNIKNPKQIYLLSKIFSNTYNNISNENITQEKYDVDIKNKYLDNHNTFLDEKIKQDLDIIDNLQTTCYKYNNQQLIIQTNYSKYIPVVKLIYCLLKITNYTDKCILGLYPSIMKKMFPNNNQPITPYNINSGFTLPYSHSIIFRKEEIIKVTIHELLHQIGVNLNIVINKNSIDKFFKYKKNDDILIDEAYVEFYACIINLLYIKTIYNLDDGILMKLLSYELQFSMLQLAKLLLHFNIYDYNDFYPQCHLLNNNNNNNNPNCISSNKVNINSHYMCANTTHPESYIIIKTAMLYYMDETLDILTKNGKNIFYPNNNKTNNNDIINYILDICGRESFVNSINEIIKLYNNNKNNTFIKETCRLTCIETFM